MAVGRTRGIASRRRSGTSTSFAPMCGPFTQRFHLVLPGSSVNEEVACGIQPAVPKEPEQAPLTCTSERSLPLPLAPRCGHEPLQPLDIQFGHRLSHTIEYLVVVNERIAQPLDSTVARRLAPARPAHRVERPRDRIGVAFAQQTSDVADLPPQRDPFETARRPGAGDCGWRASAYGSRGSAVPAVRPCTAPDNRNPRAERRSRAPLPYAPQIRRQRQAGSPSRRSSAGTSRFF